VATAVTDARRQGRSLDRYRDAARALADKIDGCPAVQQTLRDAVAEGDALQSPDLKMAILERAFSDIMEDVPTARKRVEEAGRH
jgi:hypothetical protein